MDMFAKLIENLKTTRRTIVFTEGPDVRISGSCFPSEEGRFDGCHSGGQ